MIQIIVISLLHGKTLISGCSTRSSLDLELPEITLNYIPQTRWDTINTKNSKCQIWDILVL